jgi:hypothetical protein
VSAVQRIMVGDCEAAVGRPCRVERDRTPFITNVTSVPRLSTFAPSSSQPMTVFSKKELIVRRSVPGFTNGGTRPVAEGTQVKRRRSDSAGAVIDHLAGGITGYCTVIWLCCRRFFLPDGLATPAEGG